LKRALLLFLFLTSAPLTAEAGILVDDFAVGPFTYTCPVFGGCGALGFDLPSSPPYYLHGLGPTREITLVPLGLASATARLVLGGGWIDYLGSQMEVIGDRGSVQICYDPAVLLDVTEGGVLEQWRVEMTGFQSYEALLEFTDGSFAGVTGAAHPSVTWIPLSQFPGDLTSVDRICLTVHYDGTVLDTKEIEDIRFTRKPEIDSFGAVSSQLIWCPTCPPESLSFDAFTSATSYQVVQRIESATAGMGINPCIRMTGFDSGGPTGPGSLAGADLYWDTGTDYETTAFDLRFEFPSAGANAVTLTSLPVVLSGGDSTFAVEYVLRHDAVTGGVVGSSVERITLDAARGQALRFSDVAVMPVTARGSASAAFRLSFMLEAIGNADELQPLVAWGIVSDWADGTTPTDAAVAPALAGDSALRAVPGVTRGPTELRVARPVESSTGISLFDVAGRAVRRLELPAGSASVSWDGRNEAAAQVRPGVYFASLQGAGNRGHAARIVVVR
jgi:hypothetical protein